MIQRALTRSLFTMIVLCAAVPVAGARSIDVVFDDHTVRATAYRLDGVDYVSLDDLMRAFEAQAEWDESAQRLRVQLDGRIWTFWANSALVSVDQEMGGLGDQVRLVERGLAAPLRPLAALLSQFSGMSALVQGEALRVQHRETALLGYTISDRANGLLIDLQFTRSVPYEVFEGEGNWLNMTLHRTRLSPRELNARRPHRNILEVKAIQFDSSAQISFRMRQPLDKYVVRRGDQPGRVTILFGDDVIAVPWTPTPPPPTLTSNGSDIRLIVIDPGHGGSDHGAESLDGVLLEKDVVQVLAERTAHLLERDDRFDVILTREDDLLVPISERIELVNRTKADLYIAIHTTPSTGEAGRGCQSLFDGEASNDRARAIARDVNGADTADQHDVPSSLDELARGTLRTASAGLAKLIQAEFEDKLTMPSRGVDQAPFTILQRIDIPGVVLCIGALGNLDDMDRLRRRSFQKDVAEAIVDGIIAFKNQIEQRNVSARGE